MKRILLLLAFCAGTTAWLRATPQTLSISAYDITAGQSVTFDAHAVDPDAGLVAFHFYINGPDLPGWNYIGSASVSGNDAWGSISWTPGQAGGYAVHVRAENVYGEWDWNANMATTFNVSAPNQNPQTNWVSADATVAGQPATFTGNASDPDGNLQWMNFYVTGPNLPGWNYVGSAAIGGGDATASINWTPSEPGDYAVHVRAQDDWGWYDWNGNVASEFSVGSPNSSPQTNWVSADDVLTGHPTTLTGNASDPDGNLQWMNFYITGPGMPGWNYVGSASVSGGSATASITWTPPQPGAYAVHVRAQDDWGWYDWNGNVASEFTVTDNHPPQTISVSATNISLGGATTITGRATDPDGNLQGANFYIAGPNLPAWQYIGGNSMAGGDSTVTRQWTPPYAGTYTIHIRAYDDLSEWDWNGGIMSEFTVGDGTPPSVPGGLQESSVTATSFALSWNASTDNVGVTAYEVSRNGTALPTVSGTSINVTGLSPSTTYAMAVRARDAAGNWSGWSTTRNVTTTGDTSPPSVPNGLNATLLGANSFTLSWAASTDDFGVAAYEVQRDNQSLGTVGLTSMNIAGLAPDTSYAMRVRARDAADNWSGWSDVRTVTTSSGEASAGDESIWLDVNGDGIRDELMRAGTSRFSYMIADWWTDYEEYWEYDVNEYWSAWDILFGGGFSEDGFTYIWTPSWYYFPSYLYTVTYANLAFTVDAEPGYDYVIAADTSGTADVQPAHWYSVFGTMSFPTAGLQNVILSNVDLDEVYYTQFFFTRIGRPIGGLSIANSAGTVLGNLVNGGSLNVTLPANGSLILSATDVLDKILQNGPQVVWQVVNSAGQVIDPWHVLDHLDIGVNGSGQFVVKAKLDNDGTEFSFTLNVQPPPPPPPPRIVLLLHGMNSSPATWDAFVNATFNGSSGLVSDGVLVGSAPAPNAHGIQCYRLQFGSSDYDSGRVGLESLSVPNENYPYVRCGDFESFDELSDEIDDAIAALIAPGAYPNAEIILVGHSRGGLAARTFLQKPGSSPRKAAIVGLLTTGSPHQGSPMGRIYSWLGAHPDSPRGSTVYSQDWNVVDWLSKKTTVGPFVPKPPLDVRRPVIGDLADNSPAISALNLASALGNLPTNVRYAEIVYHEVPLGVLAIDFLLIPVPVPTFGVFYVGIELAYSVFDGIPLVVSPLSDSVKTSILGENTVTTFRGDGLIPGANQLFTTLPGFVASRVTPFVQVAGNVVHTEEPLQSNDLITQLHSMFEWW